MRNYLRFSGKDLAQVASATSLVPARVIGMERDLGSLERGKLADFAVLDRASLEVTATWVGGKEMWSKAA
jgi:N-acetylglucosamine-6-phosphate deacetylase